ncbi:MAG: 1-pyrroline-5-carboxylate dehydrogenase, partial [Glaciecola sp.]
MSTGIFTPPTAYNEPVKAYAPGSPERASLESELKRMLAEGPIQATNWIDGKPVTTGTTFNAIQPHNHQSVLATVHAAGEAEITRAIDASLGAARDWAAMAFEQRAAIFLRMADLVAGPWRDRINASTMLNQSKNVMQAEVDAACEFADFLRFNVSFAAQIHAQQPPVSPNGQWNRTDWRPLEGFVLALSPFNFTAIAGNLPTAPA